MCVGSLALYGRVERKTTEFVRPKSGRTVSPYTGRVERHKKRRPRCWRTGDGKAVFQETASIVTEHRRNFKMKKKLISCREATRFFYDNAMFMS